MSETHILNKLYFTSVMGKLLSSLTASGMKKWKRTFKVDYFWQIREKISGLAAMKTEVPIKI